MPPRRAHGTIPAAFSATGKDVPPSPEVAEASLAQAIGGQVALNLVQLLGPILQRLVDVQDQPACIVCACRAKLAEHEYEIAVANAEAAAEPVPEQPQPPIRQSFTAGLRGPVCWQDFDREIDGLRVELED